MIIGHSHKYIIRMPTARMVIEDCQGRIITFCYGEILLVLRFCNVERTFPPGDVTGIEDWTLSSPWLPSTLKLLVPLFLTFRKVVKTVLFATGTGLKMAVLAIFSLMLVLSFYCLI